VEKKAFGLISLSVLTTGIFWAAVSYLPGFIDFSLELPEKLKKLNPYASFCSSILMYLIATLMLFLFLKKLPKLNGEPKRKMKVLEFLGWACAMRGVAMMLALVGALFLVIVALCIKGPSKIMDIVSGMNPLVPRGSTTMVLNIILISVIAPVMEELMFRRLLLDVLRPFGDLVAILYSGIAFGLLHMNLSQIFYAAGLGLMLGYIMVKTNNIYCCMGLHASLNIMTALALPFFDKKTSQSLLFILGSIIALSIAGIILFFINIRRVSLEKAKFRFSVPVNAKLVLLNLGTIPYAVLCLAVSVYAIYIL